MLYLHSIPDCELPPAIERVFALVGTTYANKVNEDVNMRRVIIQRAARL